MRADAQVCLARRHRYRSQRLVDKAISAQHKSAKRALIGFGNTGALTGRESVRKDATHSSLAVHRCEAHLCRPDPDTSAYLRRPDCAACGERRVSFALIAVPFVLSLVAGGVRLGLAPESGWGAKILGEHWRLCLICILLNPILPFAAIVLSIRLFAAPTNLSFGRCAAGLTAGAINALVYTLHSTDDSLAFVALGVGSRRVRAVGRRARAEVAAMVGW